MQEVQELHFKKPALSTRIAVVMSFSSFLFPNSQDMQQMVDATFE